MSSLEDLLRDASAAAWTGPPAEVLVAAIETRIVSVVPLRIRQALGADEARQRARIIAWDRCRMLAANPPKRGVEWGYLANHVRWRLSDAVEAETLRHSRHPVFAVPPDRPAPEHLAPLGPRLERLAAELALAGLDLALANRLLRAAGDGPRFNRASIARRVEDAGADPRQAEAVAWLVRGGPGFPSVIGRMASGDTAAGIFADPAVRRRVVVASTFPARQNPRNTAAAPAWPDGIRAVHHAA